VHGCAGSSSGTKYKNEAYDDSHYDSIEGPYEGMNANEPDHHYSTVSEKTE